MTNDGDQQQGPSTIAAENIIGADNHIVESSQSNSAINDLTAKQERDRFYTRVEQVMGTFRKGECSRFRALALVIETLYKWTGATDDEREMAYDLYLFRINNWHDDELENEWWPIRSWGQMLDSHFTRSRGYIFSSPF